MITLALAGAAALGVASPGLSSVTAQQAETAPRRLCGEGRIRTDDRLGCCWPGQTWEPSAGACAGEPTCPPGSVREGLECTVRCPEAMLPVVGGTFAMGSEAGDPDERPVREVTITSFCIDTTEVTVAAYRACVEASACRLPQADDFRHTWRPSGGLRHRPDDLHPINGVSWDDARGFCEWRGARLPTEAQWEYAARGTDGRIFVWGDEPRESAATCEDGPPCDVHTSVVGVRLPWSRPSAFGAANMHDNVWEWVADWYGPYADAPQRDPAGPASGTHRVLRGGDQGLLLAEHMRAANRLRAPAASRSEYVGFRCAAPGVDLGPASAPAD